MNEIISPRPNSLRSGPDARGRFGGFGGRFVAETLMPLVLDVERAYDAAKADPAFQAELDRLLRDYVGRPSPLWLAERLTAALGGARIYFKRDELNHTGSHKINNTLGQILLARRMGKTRIIAETGAGQHGVATATVCALFDLPCAVYMGAVDIERQKPNVFRMKLLGAEVHAVTSGAGTLKDAMNEAMRDWVANVRDTYYLIGTVAGPHPYPAMVRDFQSVIGTEARAQILEREGRLPDAVVAAVGGGSNAMGLFHPFLDDSEVKLHGVEAAGRGIEFGRARREHPGRPARRPARQPHLSPAGRGWANPGGTLDQRRAGLSRHRSRARLAARDRARHLRLGDGRGSLAGIPALHAHRGDHPRPGACARARARDEARARDGPRCGDPDESLRPRGQGHLRGGCAPGSRAVSEPRGDLL